MFSLNKKIQPSNKTNAATVIQKLNAMIDRSENNNVINGINI